MENQKETWAIYIIYLFQAFIKKIFIDLFYLAALGLHCRMWDLVPD